MLLRSVEQALRTWRCPEERLGTAAEVRSASDVGVCIVAGTCGSKRVLRLFSLPVQERTRAVEDAAALGRTTRDGLLGNLKVTRADHF
jgi:hypothetical protein